jgi:hypothetical protein
MPRLHFCKHAAPSPVLEGQEDRMNNLNSILVEGNLVRDPELSYTESVTAVCKFVPQACGCLVP